MMLLIIMPTIIVTRPDNDKVACIIAMSVNEHDIYGMELVM